jgi:hypothetical protein
MKQQLIDMKLAWKLLDIPNPESNEIRGLDMLKIQISQCLKDASLMSEVFDRMLVCAGGIEHLSEDEIMILFTTAPLLGRWKATIELGDVLISRTGNLSELFQQSPMDFSILYEFARVGDFQDCCPGDLIWQQYEIEEQKISLLHVDCTDQSTVAQIESEFANNKTGETWKILPTPASARLVRCGALVQVASFSAVPINLVGPADKQKMELKG